MSGTTRTAYRLKANKTKLYALARSIYPTIETMKNTEYPRTSSTRRSAGGTISSTTGKSKKSSCDRSFTR